MSVSKTYTNDLIEEITFLRQRLAEAELALEKLQSNGSKKSPEAESLRDSEHRFRTMADGTPVLIWVDNGTGRIEFINKAYSDFFGVTLGEVQSEGWHPLVHPDDADGYIQEFMQSIHERRPFRAQARVRRRDGEWRWIDSHAQPRFSDTREFLGMVGSSLDITETKQAEQALQESEARFRQLADAMPQLVWTAFPDGRVDYYNQRRIEYGGLKPSGDGYWQWELILHPDDLQRTWADWKKANEAGTTYECEHRIYMADGSYRWHISRAMPLKDELGQVYRWFGTATDIHEMMTATTKLQDSETSFRQLADAMPQLVWTAKPDGTRDYYNQRVHEYLGYRKNEDGSWEWTHAWHPDDLEETLEAWNHALETGEPYESEHRLRLVDGSYRWHLSRGVPVRDNQGHIARWYGTGTDIHDRKIAEDELRESELRLRIAKEAVQFGTYEIDAQTGWIHCDERMLELWGISPDIPLTLDELVSAIHPDDRILITDALKRAVEPSNESNFTVEYRITNQKDGLERWISSTGMVLNQDNQPMRVIGAVRDITKRKQAEQALQESQLKFFTIFQYAPFAIALSRLDNGVFLDVNQAFLEMLGLEKEEVIGKNDLELGFLPNEPERLRIRDEFNSKGFIRDIELDFHTKNGQPLTVLLNSDSVTIGGASFSLTSLENITDRKKNEQAIRAYNDQLRRSNQELQDFAYIASHDLQEPLRKIIAFSDLIGKNSSLDETEQDYLLRVQDAGRRMQKMIDDLLSLSRVTTRQKAFTWVNLSQIAKTIIDDMSARINQVQGQVILHSLPVIEADAMQMYQLIQNLLGNALKFHPPGVPPVVEIGYREYTTGKVMIYFRDNGIGFDMSYASEIFQPFKRLQGRSDYVGSGIGLAICQRIVEQYQGQILVQSAPGEGSTFSVVLPTKQPDRKITS